MTDKLSTQPADLLASLLALVAKWRTAAAVLSRTTDAIKNARAETYQSCADQLQDAIASLAAHRGEAALWVNPEQLAAARHDIAQHRMSYVRAWNTDYPPEGATQPLYAHPPQAQAGNWEWAAQCATTDGFVPGSSQWMQRIRELLPIVSEHKQAGAGDAEDRLSVALAAYNRASYVWSNAHPDSRDEPRDQYAMRAVLAALEAKP